MNQLLILLVAAGAACAQAPRPPEPGARCVENISDDDAAEIGRRIWQNEGSGKILIWWDDTADSASLGINNYLWFPAGHEAPFQEAFPGLIEFALERGSDVPAWIRGKPPAPWRRPAELFSEAVALDRVRAKPPAKWDMKPEDFAKEDSPRVKELRGWLERTIDLQARYSARRMVESLPKMLAAVPEAERAHVSRQFYRVACARGGLYDLVDYVNFKGEGVNPKERYVHRDDRGRPEGERRMVGWGLLQVLQGMKGAADGAQALHEFADAAEEAIHERVRNAPPERRESDGRWEAGWIKRIQSYRGL